MEEQAVLIPAGVALGNGGLQVLLLEVLEL